MTRLAGFPLAARANVASVPPVRRLKEILILAGLLFAAVVFVLWYVADRRARHREAPTVTKSVGPFLTGEGVEGESADGKTLDLSTGRPRVSDTPEDRRAIKEAMQEIKAATDQALFTPEEQEAAAKKAAESANAGHEPPKR